MFNQLAWDTLVEATRYWRGPSAEEVLLFFAVLTVIVVLIITPYLWGRYKRFKEIEALFFERGRSLGLTREEIALLWRYAKDLPYDPQMVFENKPLFERIVTKIVKDKLGEVHLIPSIRAKLRFDTVPWFLPITTTRDIDLYQTGKIVVDGVYVEAAVWDKTETELHIVVLGALPRTVNVGERVRFHFVRENEGRYSFESIVKDKYMEGDRLVIVLDHTDKLDRVQLRESLRWKVNIPVEFAIVKDITKEVVDDIRFLTGKIEDISTKGVRICSDMIEKPKEGHFVIMNFQLGDHRFENMIGEIVNVRVLQAKTCMGIKFVKVSHQEEKIIDRFIIEEQRKFIKTYKIGETPS